MTTNITNKLHNATSPILSVRVNDWYAWIMRRTDYEIAD